MPFLTLCSVEVTFLFLSHKHTVHLYIIKGFYLTNTPCILILSTVFISQTHRASWYYQRFLSHKHTVHLYIIKDFYLTNTPCILILSKIFISQTHRASWYYQRFLSLKHTVHLDIIKDFYSPTDAQVNCLKSNFKIYIKIDIKRALTCFGSITIIRERIIRAC